MIGTATLHLPVKTYLKKYLQKKLGDDYIVERNSWFGLYLIAILDKNYRYQGKGPLEEKDFYKVTIPKTLVLKDGFSIGSAKIKKLQTYVQKVFYADLYSYINLSIGNGLKVEDYKYDSVIKQNRQRAIKQFLSFYDINENELKFDSVYRQMQNDRARPNK